MGQGKTEVGTAMLAVDTFADKAAVQSAVTTAIANAKAASDGRIPGEIAEYTGAADIPTIATLLDASPNALGLDLTGYNGLAGGYKLNVATALFNAKGTLTTKAAIQSLLDTAVTLNSVAAAITSPVTFGTGSEASGTMMMPPVLGGYTIIVKTTTHPEFYNSMGQMIANGSSDVIYTITDPGSGLQADTATITVTVNIAP